MRHLRTFNATRQLQRFLLYKDRMEAVMNWGQFGICLSILVGCYGLYVLTRIIGVAASDLVRVVVDVVKELKRLR